MTNEQGREGFNNPDEVANPGQPYPEDIPEEGLPFPGAGEDDEDDPAEDDDDLPLPDEETEEARDADLPRP